MGECSTMSMVTERSVERYARGSFLFTAFLEIALSTRSACVLQMQSRRPLLTQKLLYVRGFLQVCLASGQYTIL